MVDEETKISSDKKEVVKQPDVLKSKEVAREIEEVKESERSVILSDSEGSPEVDEISQRAKAPAEPTQVPIKKDPILVDIENLLADDLTDIFLELPDDKKLLFKEKGEEVALKVKEMISSGRLKIRKVLQLIREWLKIVPGINKFFLEQEAKIKADKVVKYAHDWGKTKENQL